MSIRDRDIVTGKWYVIKGEGTVRQVLKIEDGLVTYRSFGLHGMESKYYGKYFKTDYCKVRTLASQALREATADEIAQMDVKSAELHEAEIDEYNMRLMVRKAPDHIIRDEYNLRGLS